MMISTWTWDKEGGRKSRIIKCRRGLLITSLSQLPEMIRLATSLLKMNR